MTQKLDFNIKLIVIIVFQLISLNTTFSQQNIKASAKIEKQVEFEFYQFVIDEYIKLIKHVEVGKAPFIVLVKSVRIVDSLSIQFIDISYTNNFNFFRKYYEDSFYYFYEPEEIAIVIDEISGFSPGISNFVSRYNIQGMTKEIMKKDFLPLTAHHHIKVKGIDADIDSENDVFSIWIYGDGKVQSFKNGRYVAFLKDFKTH
jgi:hypothetical protein